MKAENVFLTAMLAMVIGFALGIKLIMWLFVDDYRAQAVERNAATWQVDQKTGETKFQWNELPNPGGTKP